jgi:RimJ/RimL family protein N-acetyltransferase
MKNPFIIGEQVYLRALEDGDENILALSENHPDPRETLFYALPTPSDIQKEKWFHYRNDPHTVVLAICKKDTDEPIGVTAFFRIDWVSRATVYYIAIAEAKNWSKGYGSECTRLMVDYAFETLNLNRIQLHVFASNENAVKAYQHAGFKTEGTLRQAMFHHNSYCDFYVMGILQRDWIKLRK